MAKLQIIKGTTKAILKMSITHEYAHLIQSVTKDILTDYEWDMRNNKKVPLRSFSYYDSVEKELRIPINGLSYMLVMLDSVGAEYEIIEEAWYPERDIQLKMRSDFVPKEEQIPIIDYLSSNDPVRKGLATATGSGKTVSSIAGIVKYGKAAIIIVSGLHEQWIRQIKHFTDIGDNIYLIQGFQSLAKLMDSEFKPAIIVFSLETLRLYVTRTGHYQSVPSFDEFLRYFGIGVKIMDEVHLNFHAQTLIDLNSNVHNNIYLTATFDASNRYTKKILDLIYPSYMRYGEDSFARYIDVFCYRFNGEVPEKACSLQRGYMHNRYERYLLKRPHFLDRFFNNRIIIILQEQYVLKRAPGEKMLIYFARLSMVEAAAEWLKKELPKLNVVVYVGGVKDSVIDDADILVTTPKKSGTGTDIKNLIFVLNTVSFKTPVATEQLRGRLRQLKDGKTPVYAELVDVNVNSQVRHMMHRAAVHRNSARSYTIVNL